MGFEVHVTTLTKPQISSIFNLEDITPSFFLSLDILSHSWILASYPLIIGTENQNRKENNLLVK